MKFDTDIQIDGFDGKPILKPGDDQTPITLREVITTACVNADPRTVTTGEEKMRIYRVLQKAHKEGPLELDAAEIVLVKKLVAGVYGVVVVGPVFDLLEQKASK